MISPVIRFISFFTILATSSVFAVDSADRTPVLIRRPKLIVAISIDQFRADYLTRFEAKFLPAKLPGGKLGGFRYLMNMGSYFRYADHEVMQAMTGPGHATILTGSYPYLSGIPINEWYDPATKSSVYCAEDREFQTVGGTDYPQLGTSPRQLIGTTVGDELKNAGYESKVVSVAIKDRAAILLGGHRADLALWFDSGKAQWASSTYYLKDKKLPDFIAPLNQRVQTAKCDFANGCSADLTTDAALTLLKGYQLGKHSGPDLLAVGYSAHDIVGHRFGPNSNEIEQMTLAEDEALSKLFAGIEASGLKIAQDVVIVLTGDHGAAPAPAYLKETPIHSEHIDERALAKKINDALTEVHGKNGDEKYILGVNDFNFYLNHELLQKKKLEAQTVENEVKKMLSAEPYFITVFSKSDWQNRKLYPGMIEQQILKTYFPGRSGDIIALPKPFFVPKGNFATHVTGFAYDRTVPVVFAGLHFKRKVFAKTIRVVDIAPTLSFLSGTVPPALSEGRVLEEAFDF